MGFVWLSVYSEVPLRIVGHRRCTGTGGLLRLLEQALSSKTLENNTQEPPKKDCEGFLWGGVVACYDLDFFFVIGVARFLVPDGERFICLDFRSGCCERGRGVRVGGVVEFDAAG